MNNSYANNLAKFLIQSHSLKFGNFQLASGKTSRFYIDLRLIQTSPAIFHQTIIALRNRIQIEKFQFDTLATIPTSGLIFTSVLSYELFKPLIYIRKESKGYGANNLIEGKLEPFQKTLLIDDVITTGQSLDHAIENIRSNGGIIENVICILLRGGNTTLRKFTENGITLNFLLTITQLADILYKNKLIDEEKKLILQK
ncbi:MAG TPA: orotate phosphoribosyltransferase [Nitrososphaeraceae archaeon]|jgi:orotate phosphoribosyltransferase